MNDHAACETMPIGIDALHHALQDYAARWPAEAAVVDLFGGLLDEEGAADPFSRERLAGHFTASSWLVDRTGTRVLLTHHRKLDRWLQLGGHADGDRDLARVALREAEEESGLVGLSVEPAIFDLDRHWIPERGEVPGHWHYDARYIVHAGANEAYAISDESHDLAWRDITAIAADAELDPSLRRMAEKWLAR
jgi:8-oxo-dGTP pyrophosphatase MutT (NUDIX family)